MSAGNGEVGVKHEVLHEVTGNLKTNIGRMEDLIPQLERELQKLGEGADSDAMRAIIADAKKKIATASENSDKFKRYMGTAGATIASTENHNKNFVLNAYNQA